MKLIACPDCHAQYDVASMVAGSAFDCRCGTELTATAPEGKDALVHRCGGCGAVAREGIDDCEYCGAGIVHAVSRGSLICPECYARNLEDARFCLGCGVAFDPQRNPAERSDLRCPCCEKWMTAREVGGLEIDECPGCHGLWAEGARFEALVDRATKAVRERAKEGEALVPRVDGDNPAKSSVEYRRCPVCETLMRRLNYQKRSGVIVDQCNTHGTWLDANELERIAGFVLSGRAERAASMEAAETSRNDREKAREASRRMAMASARRDSESNSLFTPSSGTPLVETVFDLLSMLLR
ncbi:MAG: zf-TFIIB domain-containing protein [Myxococcota bacterium]